MSGQNIGNQVASDLRWIAELRDNERPILNLPPNGKLIMPERQQINVAEYEHFIRWLESYENDFLSSGAYALHELLMARGVETSVETIVTGLLLMDIIFGIIVPYPEKLKHSLFALSHVTAAFHSEYKPLRIPPERITSCDFPVIAHFASEEFVFLEEIQNDHIRYRLRGASSERKIRILHAKMSGFILAPGDTLDIISPSKALTNNEAAFVWG